ncbi:MAG TPA: argininosuccinate lyase [Desulfosalsimonadaceae bacterium]|nr:argininosuccinate lyase [Desulfosalsimonadaceae bacterium]
MAEKPWDGRFSEPTDQAVERFTSSIAIDKRLYHHDIDGSIAHCRMLGKCGILSQSETSTIVEGLEKVRTEIEQGTLAFSDRLEDIHMHVEDRLFAHVGSLARKLHTGRSRNDQIATDARLYLREEIHTILEGLHRFRQAIVRFARSHSDVVLPGYTHLQRAQPVLFAHHLMAYYEMFSRDAERLREVLERVNVLPLGAAALAGTTYPIDRAYTAELLGFARVSGNSMDAVSDRDFMMEFLSAASICMVHFSRLSEELVLWSSAEFSFIEISDAFATGSSIMPQKKNPDIPELVRGKSGRVIGSLVSLLTLMKSLPLAYNRDMQEDKAPVMDAVDTLQACIDVYCRMLPNIIVNRNKMADAAGTGYLNATDLADYLAVRGMPFREAHGCAGRAVNYALSRGKELHELGLEELKSFSSLIENDIYQALTPEAMINRRQSGGGTAAEHVAAQMEKARRQLAREAGET